VRLAVQQHALDNGYTLVVKPYQEVPADIEKADLQKPFIPCFQAGDEWLLRLTSR
jgi:hypothetical protein